MIHSCSISQPHFSAELVLTCGDGGDGDEEQLSVRDALVQQLLSLHGTAGASFHKLTSVARLVWLARQARSLALEGKNESSMK
jgi:hypothetical protein